jgi:hypothetical protein
MKKKFFLLAALLAANTVAAESSFEAGLRVGYRQVKDRCSEKFVQNSDSGYSTTAGSHTTVAALKNDLAAAGAARPATIGSFNFDHSFQFNDKFLTLTAPLKFHYDNWNVGIDLTYGATSKRTYKKEVKFGGHTITLDKYTVKSTLFETIAKVGYDFAVTDSITLTPSLGWEFTSISRKGPSYQLTAGAIANPASFKKHDAFFPKGSKSKTSSPFIELAAKLKPSDEVSILFSVGYSMPSVEIGQSHDFTKLEKYNTVAAKEIYKKRANKFNFQVALDWMFNDSLALNLYGKADTLKAKANKKVTEQSFDEAAAVAGTSEAYETHHYAGQLKGERKRSSWEVGAGVTYKF